jgi:hypothetical protein
MAKDNPLKALMLTEKEVASLAWSRTVQKHLKAFVLLGLLMVALAGVTALPTKMSDTLHTIAFVVSFIAWLCAMYFYFNPKYQRLKNQLLEEWNKEASK